MGSRPRKGKREKRLSLPPTSEEKGRHFYLSKEEKRRESIL